MPVEGVVVREVEAFDPGELDAPVRLRHVLGEVHREAEDVRLVVAQRRAIPAECQTKSRRPKVPLPPAVMLLRRTPERPRKAVTLPHHSGSRNEQPPCRNGSFTSKSPRSAVCRGPVVAPKSRAGSESPTRPISRFQESAPSSLLNCWPVKGWQHPVDAAVLLHVVARVPRPAAAGEHEGLAVLEARAERAAFEAAGSGLRPAPVGGVPVHVRVGVEGAVHVRPGLDQDARLGVQQVHAVEVAARAQELAAADQRLLLVGELVGERGAEGGVEDAHRRAEVGGAEELIAGRGGGDVRRAVVRVAVQVDRHLARARRR